MIMLASYMNGNVSVTLYEDGTKVREYEDTPMPIFPESIDVKITDYCDAGCAFCHEKSTKRGMHGDLTLGAHILTKMPAGTEIAIGGGNPISHPDLVSFLTELCKHGIIPNITINQFHLPMYADYIYNLINERLVFGLGISYNGVLDDILDQFVTSNTVFHLILGVHTINDLANIQAKYSHAKVLLLGYKQFGRGATYYNDTIKKELRRWYQKLSVFFQGELTLSFDNLAIEQLNLIRFFSHEDWQTFYMGNDGTFTMYMDLVKKEYAATSTSVKRYIIGDKDIQTIFASVIHGQTVKTPNN
jgi:hypothetical protein